jgi:hypothetical protein
MQERVVVYDVTEMLTEDLLLLILDVSTCDEDEP